MRPAIPAAASRWPRLVLTDPSTSGAEPLALAENLVQRAYSIGSPSAVPVPWASM